MSDSILIFKKGDIICREGAYELWFYEILNGSMTIYKDYGAPSQREIAKVSSGYIGEMGFINSMPRVGTVVADEDTTLAKIDEGSFSGYFSSHPEKIYSILQCLAGRLNGINEEASAAFNTVRECLEQYEKEATFTETLKAKMKALSDIFRGRKA